jgi:hypothetical protein
MSGWIKLHRALIDWEWYTDHNTCRLFIHCLLRANHSDTKWRGHELKRGQFLTSLESLSSETGLSVSQIRTGLKKLKSTDEIASLSQARSRVITVLKYDQYQSDDRLNDKLVAGSSQADDSEIATDKNVRSKECNNDNKKTGRFTPPTLKDVTDYFHEKGMVGIACGEAEKFINFYESKGWMVGKNKMKDWKAAVRNWIKRSDDNPNQAPRKSTMDLLTDRTWAKDLVGGQTIEHDN